MLLSDLKDLYGWKNASKFKEKYINPLIAEGLADMTVPDKPTSPNQKYYLTEKGKSLLANEIDGRYAVITSFYLGTYDDLYGGDAVLKETEYGYLYGDMPIYRVPSHEARMIVMKKELLPRCETKVYEGEDKKFKLINEQHLLYSNIFNMKEEKDGLGLIMMRDLKFYLPNENDFHYVKLVVDRMERVESELDKIKSL